MQLLDDENIRIVGVMKKHGPRNLQLIAREVGIPYETVYARVMRLEEAGVLKVRGTPEYKRIGLSRAMVLASPLPGKDLIVSEALKIPGFWITHMRCMGEVNGYYSTHAVPTLHMQEFEEYIGQLRHLGLASSSKVYWLGDHDTFIPNFEYYNTNTRRWRFEWAQWLELLSKPAGKWYGEDRDSVSLKYQSPSFDARDLFVVKEIMKDARVKLADLARAFDISLPAAKYRFDSVMKKGLVREYVFDMLPYAPDISDLYDVRLDFMSDATMNYVRTVLERLPFALDVSRIKGLSSLATRVYLPRGEMNNLIKLLTALAQNGVLVNFSYLWLDYVTITAQTFGYKKFKDDSGWYYNNSEYNIALQNILSAIESRPSIPSFEPMSMITA